MGNFSWLALKMVRDTWQEWVWGGRLAAKRTHQGTANKESGNSVPQLQKTEFCQQPEGA